MKHKKNISTKAAKEAAIEDMRQLHIDYHVLYTAKTLRELPKQIIISIKVC